MTVYVDEPIHPYGRMMMCHMWADSLEELLDMVDKIGVPRKWLQQPPKASWVHFDVSKGKRAEAIFLGAVATDRFGPLIWQAEQALKTPDLPAPARILAEGRLALYREASIKKSTRASRESGDLFEER